MGPEPVTSEDVRDLLTGGRMDATLIRWADTGEVQVVAEPTLRDISWSERGRDYAILTTANDLGSIGDYDADNPTNEDCEALAEMLNEA